MRIRTCIVSVCCGMFFVLSNQAFSHFLHKNLVQNQIKPNLSARSKPTFPKYASVNFISDTERQLNIKPLEALSVEMRCKMAGYYTTQTACNAKGAKYGPRCGDDASISLADDEKNEANKYVAGCCGKNYVVTDPEACPDHSIYSGNSCPIGKGQNYNSTRLYECICNRDTYIYGADNPCPSGYASDEKDICKSTDKNGLNKTFYRTCCPTSGSNAYKTCDSSQHLLGSGNYCITGGQRLYENCVCSSGYNKRKSDCKTFVINGNDICRLNNVDYITEDNCYKVCSESDHEDLDRFYNNNGLSFLYSVAKNLGLMEE